MAVTRDQAIKELERELRMREQVYPKQIMRGKLNRDRAKIQYVRMRAAINFLKGDNEKVSGKQQDIF